MNSQVLRLSKAFKAEGASGLAHGLRGHPSARSTDTTLKSRIVALAEGEYQGANLTHFAELLAAQEQIVVSPKTIGRILQEAGVARAKRRRSPPRAHPCRPRRDRAGELVQADASTHDWLEGRDAEHATLALHGIIDDATGRILGLVFRPTEDTLGYLLALYQLVTSFGIPLGFYSDRHTLFFSPDGDKLSVEDQLDGKTAPLTQFGRALDKLDVSHIKARSPQAKGRIERLWQTLQDRLILEMRIAGIHTLEAANAFLPGFLTRFNAQFAVVPAQAETAWRPAPSPRILETVICFRHDRLAANGCTVSFGKQLYRLLDDAGRPIALTPRKPVEILEHLDGTYSALYNNRRYSLRAIPKHERIPPSETSPTEPPKPPTTGKPAANHPWRRPFKPDNTSTSDVRYNGGTLGGG